MIGIVLAALLVGPSMRLKVGDHWSATRTIHYTSRAADIDMQDDDEFTYRVDQDETSLLLRVSRHTLGTHLSSGVFLPATAGEPETWVMPITEDGALKLDAKPLGHLETVLSKLVLAAWNGSGEALGKLFEVKPIDANREHVMYDEAKINSNTRIEGDATLDPRYHVPIQVKLKGRSVELSSGDRVSIEVDYEVRLNDKQKGDGHQP